MSISDHTHTQFSTRVAITFGLALISLLLISVNRTALATADHLDRPRTLQPGPLLNTSAVTFTKNYTGFIPIAKVAVWGWKYVIPGFYPQQTTCPIWKIYINEEVVGKISWCVVSVRVYDNAKMRFNLSWTATYVAPGYHLWKDSDVGNLLMNVGDDLGNRYHFIDLGDAAAQKVYFYRKGDSYTGWFLFSAPNPNAQLFTFYADDQGQKITDITLHP